MKINLRFSTKQKPVQTGIRVNTRVKAGFKMGMPYESADEYLKDFQNSNPDCTSYSKECTQANWMTFFSCSTKCFDNAECNGICTLGHKKVVESMFPVMEAMG